MPVLTGTRLSMETALCAHWLRILQHLQQSQMVCCEHMSIAAAFNAEQVVPVSACYSFLLSILS